MKCILIWQICKNMHPHFADGATVPRCCKWAWVWLGWLQRLAGGVLQWHPLWLRLWRLVFSQHWTKIRPICYPVGVALYLHAQDHKLLTWDILGYPSLFDDIVGQPLISKVIQFSGGQWRYKEESRDQPPPRGSQAWRWTKRKTWVHLKGYPRLTQSRIIILTYPGLYKSGQCGHLIPTYPWICKSRHLIPTYSGLSQSKFSIKGYPSLSWLAQGVVFPDAGLASLEGAFSRPGVLLSPGQPSWASGSWLHWVTE